MPVIRRTPLNVALLEILREKTDAKHPLRSLGLSDELLKGYNLTPTRKSITCNINDLKKMGYPIRQEHGWYYDHEFTTAELDILIDDVLCSSQLPEAQRMELVAKLRRLGGEQYQPEFESTPMKIANPEFLQVLSTLHEAINMQQQVSFNYGDYGLDKQLHPRKGENGRNKLYHVNPYRILTNNGRYYLVCNVDKYDELCHFRVERITNVSILKKNVKPLRRVKGGKEGIQDRRYMVEHPYMYAVQPVNCIIHVKNHRRDMINEAYDTFGMDIEFFNDDEANDTVDFAVRADEVSIQLWVNKYQDRIELKEKFTDAQMRGADGAPIHDEDEPQAEDE